MSYDRDSHGRLSALVHGFNAVRQEYTYDAHWRLSGYSIHSYYTGGSGSPLHQESYAYDSLDRRTRVDYGVQTGAGGAVSATRREWGYDSAGRLAREERFPSASGTTADWGRTWGYDGAGNRNSEARYDGSSTSTFSRTHNAWNQAPSAVHGDLLAWDHEGNLVVSHNEARSYGWDRANRLTLVSGEMESGDYEDVYYGYDPSGRLIDRERVYGTLEKRYYADGLSPILVKRWDSSLNSGAGGWKIVRTAMIIPGVIGHVAAEREATAWNGSGVATAFTDRHYHYDLLGNTVLETGTNAAVLARTEMEAYGEMVRESNSAGTWESQPSNSSGNRPNAVLGAMNRPRQTTKETDPDTGLRWFGARWYDTGLGGWIGEDPVPFRNRFRFSASNPSNTFDKNGKAPMYNERDLNWPECNLENIFNEGTKCLSDDCGISDIKAALKNDLGTIQGILNGKGGPLAPPPGADPNKINPGVTQNGIPYFNPNHPKTGGDICLMSCTCVHEFIHVLQAELGISARRSKRELPAYAAGAICHMALLSFSY